MTSHTGDCPAKARGNNMESVILYQGAHYTACRMKNGDLIVTSNREQKGKRLTGDLAEHWAKAIKDELAADDWNTTPSICHNLCKAIMAS